MPNSQEIPDPATLHRQGAPAKVRFGVITISTSRAQDPHIKNLTIELLAPLLKEFGHELVTQNTVPDNLETIQSLIKQLIHDNSMDALILTGGTGIAASDVTIEAVRPLFAKELSAFGSIFAWLSYEQVRSAVILSRATAGIIEDKPVFVLPGSPKAVQLAFQKIILPEIGHILNLCRQEHEER
ncbi:MAG: molybdenum cofactor biosynthesis protein B [Candidatus Hodarchaeota archaeon]